MSMGEDAPVIVNMLRNVRKNEGFSDEVVMDEHVIRVHHRLHTLAALKTLPNPNTAASAAQP
jgi:hypothetical protein